MIVYFSFRGSVFYLFGTRQFSSWKTNEDMICLPANQLTRYLTLSNQNASERLDL
jgi:hypothetical protein